MDEDNKRIQTRPTHPILEVEAELDYDRELQVVMGAELSTYLTEAGARELRDHLSRVLGDAPKPPVSASLTGTFTFTLAVDA